MFVSDLRHFLDLPDDAPGPARKLAGHLGSIVRAATSAPAGTSWVSALPCRRRPERRPCPGRIALRRLDVPARIEWRCTICGDDGVISGWEGSCFDLRAPGISAASSGTAEIVVSDEVLAALRDLLLVDSECERLVYGARVSESSLVLAADQAALEELADFVAAEANHEANRRRQQRLDHAFEVLSDALRAMST